MKIVRLLISGRVQGVGFRATTASIATRLGLRGFVRNLPDGRVEIVCCQEDARVNKLLDALSETYGGFIEDHQELVSEVNGDPGYSGFQIKR